MLTPEPESRYHFVVGRTHRIRLRTEPPRNIGLQILKGRSGGRLGFSPESIHDADLKTEAAQVAAKADFAIVFTDHHTHWETEGQDQASFHLPHDQDDLISAVADVNSNVIVVNSTGVAVAMPWLHQVKVVIQSWFLGQECGNAIADVLTGAVNPEGHLPVSFPRFIEDAPAHDNFPGTYVDDQLRVNYAEGIFVGYRHYDRLFTDVLNSSFGHGLSYTKFGFRDLKVGQINKEKLTVSIQVINLGLTSVRALVQLYLGRKDHANEHPIPTLAGFQQVWVEVGVQVTAELCIDLRDISLYDEKRNAGKLTEWISIATGIVLGGYFGNNRCLIARELLGLVKCHRALRLP
jgi:beta-glucosidase